MLVLRDLDYIQSMVTDISESMTGHPGLGAYFQLETAAATFLSMSVTPELRTIFVFDTVPSSLIWNLTLGGLLYDSFGRKVNGPLAVECQGSS
jgi:hypothetical protein